MNIKRIKSGYQNLGPGMLFAAQSVGTSHLVQSTRAGAEYGFSLTILIMLACLVKYPAFRFGVDYATATGKSVLDHYFQQGRFVMLVFTLNLLIDMFVATAAVTLVSAGLLSVLFGLDLNTPYLAVGLLCIFALLLIAGGYQVFEMMTKLFVIIFSLLAVIVTVLALLKMPTISADFLPAVGIGRINTP